jgi:hypothetical protein
MRMVIIKNTSRCRWLAPEILATQEAEIRRIVVQSQPGQTVYKTLSRKTLHKTRTGGVVQSEGPEFKPQYCQKKKEEHKQQMLARTEEKRNPHILLVRM